MCDPQYQEKLSKLFETTFKQAGEPQQLVDEFKNMISQGRASDPWKLPNSHHVTTLFIGGNRSKL